MQERWLKLQHNHIQSMLKLVDRWDFAHVVYKEIDSKLYLTTIDRVNQSWF